MFKRKLQPIIRRKLSFFVVPSLIVSLIFIVYQIRMFYLLSKGPIVSSEPPNLPRGIHEQNAEFYRIHADKKFRCLHSMEVMDIKKVNDDYCDCLDGTDEPGTNACPNGVFHCGNFRVPFSKSLPSNRVNDGICDCCDGSDEYGKNDVLSYLPCSNRC